MIEQMKAIFFDLDDTLINFGGVTKSAWEKTCEELVKEYPHLKIKANELANGIVSFNDKYWNDDTNRKNANKDFKQGREDMLSVALEGLGINNVDVLSFLLQNYAVYKEEMVYIFPKVHETLNILKNKGSNWVLSQMAVRYDKGIKLSGSI